MPNINIPNVPLTDGSPADADQVMGDVYLPKLIPDNLEVINGRLTNPNRDGWTIDSSDVRQGHFSQSGQVAATANQDYFSDFLNLTSTSTIGDFEDQAMAIPGCSIAFFVPFPVTAVSLSWHLSLITDTAVTTPTTVVPHFSTGRTRLMLFLDGFPVRQMTRQIIDGNYTMAYDSASPGTYHNNYTTPDTRQWSGNFLYENSLGSSIIPSGNTDYLQRGWHTASIRLAFTPLQLIFPLGSPQDYEPAPGTGVRQVRVKTRRMSYTLIR